MPSSDFLADEARYTIPVPMRININDEITKRKKERGESKITLSFSSLHACKINACKINSRAFKYTTRTFNDHEI